MSVERSPGYVSIPRWFKGDPLEAELTSCHLPVWTMVLELRSSGYDFDKTAEDLQISREEVAGGFKFFKEHIESFRKQMAPELIEEVEKLQ